MGTSLSGLTPQNTYPGLLKFGDNSAISASLKAISDGAGNDTMIQLSTTALQIGGSTGMYWDNTNKRLGVGTSAPGAPLTVVGNIFNLASNGKRWNTSPQGTEWRFASDSAEIMALYDNGVKVSSTPSVAPTARFQIVGNGSTSATTSLLVQNSAGLNALQVNDDRAVILNGSPSSGYVIDANGSNASARFGNCAIGTWGVGGIFSIGSTNSTAVRLAINNTAALYLDTNQSVNVGTVSAVASAKLQVDSTTQGFLPPRMTTTQKNAISSPAAGLVVYDTTLAKLCVYTTTWETITSL